MQSPYRQYWDLVHTPRECLAGTIREDIKILAVVPANGVGRLPGSEEHGRHARHNIGISVVREDREIVLEDAFLREGGSADNPQNRWWGCEVCFRRACDELFGVDHNKRW